MSTRSLYQRLKESNMIHVEVFRREPSRAREKATGYMWDGELEIKLLDGTRIVFDMWHNFCYDDGDDWYPEQKELDAAWRPKWVPSELSPKAQLLDGVWHTIYVDDHIYISKEGTSFGKRNTEEIKTKIRDGSWEQDKDLYMLV